MASVRATFIAIGIVVIILAAAAVGLLYFFPTPGETSKTSTTPTSSASTIVTSTSTTSSSTVTSSPTTSSSMDQTSTSSSSASSTRSTPNNYLLSLASAGSGPVVNQNLTIAQNKTYIKNDLDVEHYQGWSVTGDLEPGVAWFASNSSGITLSDQTCDPLPGPAKSCSTFSEWQIAHEENLSEVAAVLYDLPSNATVFSITATIPYYSFLASCVYNVSSNGCSYQGSSAMVSANWALDVTGSNSDNSIAISFAQGSSGLLVSAATASIANNEYVGGKWLGSLYENDYTPTHRLTIATDRKSYIALYFDNKVVYANNSLPISLNGSGLAVSFYQFTSVSNATVSTTWSNFTAYASNRIAVSGLSSGMSVVVNGTDGFSAVATAGTNGVAYVDVSPDPVGLVVSVQLGGETIATYKGTVEAGASLNLTTG